MKANNFLLKIKNECKKHKLCEESCLFYKPDCDTTCAICRLIGENPIGINFEEITVLASGESIELPANLKIKAENVYININGGEN